MHDAERKFSSIQAFSGRQKSHIRSHIVCKDVIVSREGRPEGWAKTREEQVHKTMG